MATAIGTLGWIVAHRQYSSPVVCSGRNPYNPSTGCQPCASQAGHTAAHHARIDKALARQQRSGLGRTPVGAANDSNRHLGIFAEFAQARASSSGRFRRRRYAPARRRTGGGTHIQYQVLLHRPAASYMDVEHWFPPQTTHQAREERPPWPAAPVRSRHCGIRPSPPAIASAGRHNPGRRMHPVWLRRTNLQSDNVAAGWVDPAHNSAG